MSDLAEFDYAGKPTWPPWCKTRYTPTVGTPAFYIPLRLLSELAHDRTYTIDKFQRYLRNTLNQEDHVRVVQEYDESRFWGFPEHSGDKKYQKSCPIPLRHARFLATRSQMHWPCLIMYARLRLSAYYKRCFVTLYWVMHEDRATGEDRMLLSDRILDYRTARQGLELLRRCRSGPLAARVKMPVPYCQRSEWWTLTRV